MIRDVWRDKDGTHYARDPKTGEWFPVKKDPNSGRWLRVRVSAPSLNPEGCKPNPHSSFPKSEFSYHGSFP